ncbi:MAG TPA: hypothetical protein VGO59_07150 [Verrucomicrobiae bacterium]|jgi:hypothetical protein
MSVTRSQLTGGPAYAAFNGQNIQFTEDSKVETALATDVIATSLYGDVDEIYKDLIVKASGQPLFYDTAALATMFPYLAASVGTVYPGSTDKPCVWNSNNGDTVTLTSALIGKMPDLELGVDGPALGRMEIWGIVGNGDGAGTANSYYTLQTGQGYSNPPAPGTAVLGRQEFTAAWGTVAGFASFQAQDKWTISHELKLEAVTIQGRTRAFKLAGYRAMAKCKPLGPTMAQIDAALYAQGAGTSGGYRLSTNAANLVITGSSSMTATLGSAALKTAGYVFGGKPLRYGELGWVSTLPINVGGAPGTPALALA